MASGTESIIKEENMAQKKNVEIIEEVETADATPKKKKREIPFRIGDIGRNVMAYQKELGLPETGIWDAKSDKLARG